MSTWKCITSFCIILLCLAPQAISSRQKGHRLVTRQADAKSIIESESSVNLGCILERQKQLERECAKYHTDKLKKLEYLVKFNDDSDHPLHLPDPIPVEVPAICLFLFSQFGGPTPMNPGPTDQSTGLRRLDMVNWVYNAQDIRENSDNMTKRSVATAPPDHLIDDFLLDPTATSYAQNEVDSDEKIKFHEDVEKIMKEPGFKQAIKQSKATVSKHLSPVILVPGLLGSRLQGRTDKMSRVNIFCSKQSDWQDLWLSIRQLLPLVVDCWLDNVRLVFDPKTGFTRAPSGVQARVADFGSVESVRHLDLRQPRVTEYFGSLIDRYEQIGYTADKNLLAAPYDFRLAPQELGAYFQDLKQLIETAQDESSSGKKVTLVCHSMGCTHLLVFLRQQSAAWRQNRIRKLIALSSPWGGAVKALKALVVGDQLELPLISEVKMRKLARTYPSIAFLLPQPEIFGQTSKLRAEPGGPVLVETPSRQYRVSDMDQLLRDLNLTNQLEWYKQTVPLIKPLEPLPDVRVDCIHSLNVPTPQTLMFRKEADFPDGDYELIKGEGDGTVNFESLIVCHQWAQQYPDLIKHKVIMNTNHVGVLTHKTTLTHITDDVFSGQ